jgi:hypothetical protein
MVHTPTFAPSAKSACPRAIMRAFLDDPRAHLSTDCVATITEAWT